MKFANYIMMIQFDKETGTVMNQTKITEIGSITDRSNSPLFRMWTANVPSGKRPLQHHRHFQFEITRVDHGNGIYTIEHHQYPIQPGDFFVFSSNEFHSITNIGKEGLQITNLHFCPQFLWDSAPERHTRMNINFCFSHNPDFSNRIACADAGNLTELFRQMKQEISLNDQEACLSIKSLLSLFLISLVRRHSYLNPLSDTGHDQLYSIRHVLSYIDGHFDEKITLQELSALAGLTPTYFSTLFKQAVGISLWNYISSKRIDKAVRLITSEETKQNMLDIAGECGFHNSANFNKTFKKFTGMTPREYQKNMGAEIS